MCDECSTAWDDESYDLTDAGYEYLRDDVNHPKHYTAYPGIEVIDLTKHMNFCRGNAVKYIARAGLKNPETEVEDLRKAIWYLECEIGRIQYG